MSVGLAVVGAETAAIASARPNAKAARNLGLDALRAALTLLVVFHPLATLDNELRAAALAEGVPLLGIGA